MVALLTDPQRSASGLQLFPVRSSANSATPGVKAKVFRGQGNMGQYLLMLGVVCRSTGSDLSSGSQ
jgi:hypothetical protein